MRILLTTQPAYGHFRPLLPLAIALRARGHEIRVGTAACWGLSWRLMACRRSQPTSSGSNRTSPGHPNSQPHTSHHVECARSQKLASTASPRARSKDVHRDLASERGVGALMIVGVDPVGESPEALVVGDHT